MGGQTDPTEVVRGLNRALPLQARDALAAAIGAGTVPGPQGIALSEPLRRIAADELADVAAIAARIVTLGGTPAPAVEAVALPKTWRAAAQRLIAWQREALDALVEAIPADDDDAEGEATEHLLEHVIARKRDAIELLERAVR
jgi:bacterioferritin (cytochrome b1)